MFGDDSVQGASSLIGNNSWVDLKAVSLLVLLDEFLLFKLLQSPSDDLGSSVLMSFWSDFSSVKSTVNVGQESDSGSWSDVNFSGQWSDFVVNPIFIDWGELISGWKFDSVNPSWSFDEVVLLEVLSEDLDELLGWKVLDSEEGLLGFSNHFCGLNIIITIYFISFIYFYLFWNLIE